MTRRTTSYQRKQFFLSDSSQPRLLVGIELIFLILLVISGAIFYLIANRNLTTTYFQAHLHIKNMLEILIPLLIAINLVGLIIGAVLTLFYTHRIAGPVYRLCRILRQAGQGNLAQAVNFRKDDELKELDKATTEMLTALNQRVQKLRTIATEVNAEAQAIATAHPALNGDLSDLTNAAQALEQELAAFRLVSDISLARPSESE